MAHCMQPWIRLVMIVVCEHVFFSLCRGDCIRDHPTEFSWKDGLGKKMAKDALSGLCALHARGIRHQDIKTGNIFVSLTGVAKVADVGLAETMTKCRTEGQPAFTVADFGKMVSIRGGVVKVQGKLREVTSGVSALMDVEGQIKRVEERPMGKVQLEDGLEFENLGIMFPPDAFTQGYAAPEIVFNQFVRTYPHGKICAPVHTGIHQLAILQSACQTNTGKSSVQACVSAGEPDVYSMAVVMAALHDRREPDPWASRGSGPWPGDIPPCRDALPWFRNLLERMLKTNTTQRPSAFEVLKELSTVVAAETAERVLLLSVAHANCDISQHQRIDMWGDSRQKKRN